jgi:hypothetical protein
MAAGICGRGGVTPVKTLLALLIQRTSLQVRLFTGRSWGAPFEAPYAAAGPPLDLHRGSIAAAIESW